MFDFIATHCARYGSTQLSEFKRALKQTGLNMPHTAIVAQLSNEFTLTEAGGQLWIVGLSLRATGDKLHRFIDRHCLRADGLTCKLSDLMRALKSDGYHAPRTYVVSTLQNWGFNIDKHNGSYVVAGIGLKEALV